VVFVFLAAFLLGIVGSENAQNIKEVVEEEKADHPSSDDVKPLDESEIDDDEDEEDADLDDDDDIEAGEQNDAYRRRYSRYGRRRYYFRRRYSSGYRRRYYPRRRYRVYRRRYYGKK